jgi:hypothetical protein
MTTDSMFHRPRKLDSDAAADYIGVSHTTLPTWRSTKRYDLPYLKVGRKVYYLVDDLDRWLESRMVR